MLIAFLFLNKNICCGYSLEAPQRGASNEYPQHMSSLRNKKNIMWIPPLICSYATSSIVPSTHSATLYYCHPVTKPIKWHMLRAYAPSEDSDQPVHPPSLIRVFVVRMKTPWVLSYPLSTQRRLIWVFTGRTSILLVLLWDSSMLENCTIICQKEHVICEAHPGGGGTCSLVPLKYFSIFLCSPKSKS